jgi:hypothetical protein
MPSAIKQTISVKDRLVRLAKEARDRAEAMPPGAKREALMKAAKLSETALQVQQWLSSPGLRAPK